MGRFGRNFSMNLLLPPLVSSRFPSRQPGTWLILADWSLKIEMSNLEEIDIFSLTAVICLQLAIK